MIKLEHVEFEKEAKRISKTYNITSIHSECFLVNHGNSNPMCIRCLEQTKCLSIKEKEEREMSKSLCHDCIHNCTDHRNNICANHKGIWCNAEYGRVINKKVKGCKNYIGKENKK